MERKYTIGEFAKLTGMTERTLRHYDQTGILKPAELTEYGHRVYNNRSIIQLQKILVLKFLDLSLGEILAYVESRTRFSTDNGRTEKKCCWKNKSRLIRLYKP